MHKPYKMVREAVKKFPLPLLDIKDPKIRNYANSLLPTTVGMEISIYCLYQDSLYNAITEAKNFFEVIDLSEGREPKICLKKGIDGFIGLWELCKILKEHGELNPIAGIHYHVFHEQKIESDKDHWYSDSKMSAKILKALDTWNYKGSYNSRSVSFEGKDHCWVNLNRRLLESYTAEFRIGEMTFDYKLLVKRILNCTNIISSLKSSPKKETKLPKLSTW